MLVVALVIAAAEYLDDRIQDPHAVLAATDPPAIGAIPFQRGDPQEAALARAQSFRLLTRKLVAATSDDLPRTLLITSAEAAEGKRLRSPILGRASRKWVNGCSSSTPICALQR